MEPTAPKVLVVEDTGTIAMVYNAWLAKAGYDPKVVGTGEEALKELRSGEYRLALLDLQLPDIGGMDVLKAVQTEGLALTIIVVTASGSISTAISAMREGAYDFIVKPTAEERLITTVRNALERDTLRVTVKRIREEIGGGSRHGFVGSSLPMLSVYRTIDSVARSNASVFITGESGTGKEVCAQAIHNASARARAPFIALNCAAIPKDLIESEVFGHVKGAFTGATSDRSGAALAANGGTLFLDEICEMDIALQGKLLRFIQTGQVQKVGSDRLEKVDVRIICATNRDPWAEVEAGRFREDLFFRLHVVPIHLPPLRDREGDVVEIATALLAAISAEEGKAFIGFTEDAENALLMHSWTGNVRELQNVVRNAVVLNEGEKITADMLSFMSGGTERVLGRMLAMRGLGNSEGMLAVSLESPLEGTERQIIEAAIAYHDNSIPKAAEALGLSPSTIYRKREGWAKTLSG